MLAGFRAGVQAYHSVVNNINADSDTEMVDDVEFSWGDQVQAFGDWASSISLAKRPARKAKKYISLSQDSHSLASSKSQSASSQVKRWYAAKGTSRPGAYVHKHVAESYRVNGRGTIKMF